jgi:hypothetical protein
MAASSQFLVAKHVFDFVAANPGKKQEDVVAALADIVTEMKRSPATARTMLYALKRAGAVVRVKDKGTRAGTFVIAAGLEGQILAPEDLKKYVTRAPLKLVTEAIVPVAAAAAEVQAPEYDVTKFSPPKGEGDSVRIPKGQPGAGRFLPRFVRSVA